MQTGCSWPKTPISSIPDIISDLPRLPTLPESKVMSDSSLWKASVTRDGTEARFINR